MTNTPMSRLLRRWFSRRRFAACGVATSSPCGLQQLEPRLLMSASLRGDSLLIRGDAAPNAIQVSAGAVDGQVIVTGAPGVADGSVFDGVRRITITTGRGDDTITVATITGIDGNHIGVRVNSGPGHDHIDTGDGDDRISAGSGNDVVNAAAGDDRIHGGSGDNTIDAGDGDDRVTAGSGNDVLRGGLGLDRLRGGRGLNWLYGRVEEDLLKVSERFDRLISDDTQNPLQKLTGADAFRHWLSQLSLEQFRGKLGQVADLAVVRGGGEIFTLVNDRNVALPPALDDSVVTAAAFSTGADYSETNTQEQGVDEADIVETDGNYIYILSRNELIIVSAQPADAMEIVSRTTVEGDANAMYLAGDRLVIVSQKWDALPWYDDTFLADTALFRPIWFPSQPKQIVTVYDVGNRSAPAIVEETEIDGSLIDSRVIDGELVLVVQNNLPVPDPYVRPWDVGFRMETEAEYMKRIKSDDAMADLPGYTATGPDGSEVAHGSLVDGNVFTPVIVQGEQMMSILTFDVTDGVAGPDATTSVVGVGGQVYATADNLYIIANTWGGSLFNTGLRGVAWQPTSNIYQFDLTGDEPDLAAVGSVGGTIVDRFAVSEKDGYLRITTTSFEDGESSNNLFVLSNNAGTLEVAGSLTGLAGGERLFATRFKGDRAFMVTYRQVDPLFAIDLSDPANPVVAGELKIPGFSNYLQPLDENHLIGLGRDGTDEGRTLGLQVSLFNVSDLSDPQRVDTYTFSEEAWGGWSEATYDPHALSLFTEQGVLALPVSGYNTEDGDWSADLVVLNVDAATGFELDGVIEHDSPVRRSLRVGDVLYSISETQVQAHQLNDVSQQLGQVQFNEPYEWWRGGGEVILF